MSIHIVYVGDALLQVVSGILNLLQLPWMLTLNTRPHINILLSLHLKIHFLQAWKISQWRRKASDYNFPTIKPEHNLKRVAPRTLYRVCNTVARQNSNALHLIMRGRKDESVSFIVLVVTKESQWEALSTFLKIDAQD